MPLQRRLPKFGFKNINRVSYKAINLDILETLAAAKNLDKVTIEDLRAAGYINKNTLVKILANGEITRKLEVEANAFSAAAEKAIVAAGGSINKV
jgi:large subunit ribosomal protein L15